jgi:hypothetical protein
LSRAGVTVLALLVAGCGGLSADPGRNAALQVAGAQFVPGPLPGDGDGPEVHEFDSLDRPATAGTHDRPLSGRLGPTATAVALALDGDRGYWIAVAQPPASDEPTLPMFDLRVSFAATLSPGAHAITAHAADARGHYGAALSAPFNLVPAAVPTGPLVVHLAWRGPADLDLHVIDPAGVEIYAGHPSAYQPPPPPALPDPNGPAHAAQLDLDSNADCDFDGRDQENVVWPTAPPSGHYIVRVDAPSLCGAALAAWQVDVRVDGNVRASASGEALDSDTRGTHRAGAGRTALELDLP